MTVETYIRIIAFILVAGWSVATLPRLVTGRWRVGDQVMRWPELPVGRRAEIVRNGGAILLFGLGAALTPDRKLGMVVPLAIVLPGLITALWWGRIDFGSNHILRSERPGPYWTVILIGALLSAGILATLIWVDPVVIVS